MRAWFGRSGGDAVRFEFCWQHRGCDKACPVRETQSIFCWRLAHKESFCHPEVCRQCGYRRNWFAGRYDLQEFLAEHDRKRGRPKAQRILAVDDEPNFLFALEESVRNLGCNCLTGVDGAEGLLFARQTRPELIVTDVLMPEMNGYDLCRALKADPLTAGIPVVMVSVKNTQRDRDAGMDAGAAGYLVKPLRPADLERQIRELLPGGARTAEPPPLP